MRSRARTPVLALAALLLLAQAAGAALLRYEIREFSLQHFEFASPDAFIIHPDGPPLPPSRGLIDESGASPVLRKLLLTGDLGQTTLVPQLSGFIWFGVHGKEGPSGEFTGTGSSASSIAWGQLTGWTTTGTTFCNSSPSFVCDLAVGSQLGTISNSLRSTFYDIGTWVFHGTGFTAVDGFVYFTATLPGNTQIFVKGELDPNGTVPALPLLGMAAVGASLFAMGLSALRRRRP